MQLVFDIETDGLYADATTIWCMVAIDENNKVYSFTPNQIEKGIEFLKSADKIIGHNIIGFDIPVIKKLTGVGCDCKWVVVDHLHMLVSALAEGDERRAIDNIMTRLRSLVEDNCAILLEPLKCERETSYT